MQKNRLKTTITAPKVQMPTR